MRGQVTPKGLCHLSALPVPTLQVTSLLPSLLLLQLSGCGRGLEEEGVGLGEERVGSGEERVDSGEEPKTKGPAAPGGWKKSYQAS